MTKSLTKIKIKKKIEKIKENQNNINNNFINNIAELKKENKLLKEENSDLWAHFPGKSKVNIYQNFYFYNINDRADIPFSNKQIVANEIGPFSAKEITDYDNRRFSSDNTTVGFTVFKYFESTPEEMKKQEDAVFNPINVV